MYWQHVDADTTANNKGYTSGIENCNVNKYLPIWVTFIHVFFLWACFKSYGYES